MAIATSAGRHLHRTYTGHVDECDCGVAIKIQSIEQEMRGLVASRILARLHGEAKVGGDFAIAKAARIFTEEEN